MSKKNTSSDAPSVEFLALAAGRAFFSNADSLFLASITGRMDAWPVVFDS